MITSYQEAQFLYSICEAERCEQEIALQVAEARLQRAKQKFQYTQKRLTTAGFCFGRTRYMMKKGGFSDILQQTSYGVKRRPVIKVYHMYIPSLYLNPPHNQYSSDNRSTTIPGVHFALKLD
jgi:hypothetical protein